MPVLTLVEQKEYVYMNALHVPAIALLFGLASTAEGPRTPLATFLVPLS